ncbi:hypothetical protein Ciccas_008108 [Cichlidogyrus casuarinus]|uniref:Uncharacterized protein n=1 Tax=Cichlidogyrus casuarinus TaxID=1844966 RepID=A0ABD2Q0X7_9PLAT
MDDEPNKNPSSEYSKGNTQHQTSITVENGAITGSRKLTCEVDNAESDAIWYLQSAEIVLGHVTKEKAVSFYINLPIVLVNSSEPKATTTWKSSLTVPENFSGVFKCGNAMSSIAIPNSYQKPEELTRCLDSVCKSPFKADNCTDEINNERFPTTIVFSDCLLAKKFHPVDCCATGLDPQKTACLESCALNVPIAYKFPKQCITVLDKFTKCLSLAQTKFSPQNTASISGVLLLPPGNKAIVFWPKQTLSVLLKISHPSIPGQLAIKDPGTDYHLFRMDTLTGTEEFEFSTAVKNNYGFSLWSVPIRKALGNSLVPDLQQQPPRDVTKCCDKNVTNFKCAEMLCAKLPIQLHSEMFSDDPACFKELPKALACHASIAMAQPESSFQSCCQLSGSTCKKYCSSDATNVTVLTEDLSCLPQFLPFFGSCLRVDFPQEPKLFAVVYRTDSSVKLRWSAAQSLGKPEEKINYLLREGASNAKPKIIETLEYEFTDLASSMDYVFELYAKNSFGESAKMQRNARTLAKGSYPPPKVVRLSQLSLGQATMHIEVDPAVKKNFRSFEVVVYRDWEGRVKFKSSDTLTGNIITVNQLIFNSNYSLKAACRPLCSQPYEKLKSTNSCAQSHDFGYVTFCLNRGYNSHRCCKNKGIPKSCLDACKGTWHSISAEGPDLLVNEGSGTANCIDYLPLMNLCFQSNLEEKTDYKILAAILILFVLTMLCTITLMFVIAVYWTEKGFPTFMHKFPKLKSTLQRMSSWALKRELQRANPNPRTVPVTDFDNPIK